MCNNIGNNDINQLISILNSLSESKKNLLIGYATALRDVEVLEKYEKNKETDSKPELAE